jgi:TetR/AcrR family transcriptional regulator, transcriptional repressor for nem operon
MSRAKEFDPEVALTIAMEVFWRLGYEHTSIEILMGEMRISKQSLYDTFGDKRSIYLQALNQYRKMTNGSLRKLFAADRSVKGGFAKLFQSMVSESKAQHERGCLLLSANLASAIDDAEIKKFLRANQREVEGIFQAALAEAKRRGGLERGKDPAALAKFFVATIQGMRALARLNHDRQELENIAAVALKALD